MEQGLEPGFLIAVELGASSEEGLSDAQRQYAGAVRAKLEQVRGGGGAGAMQVAAHSTAELQQQQHQHNCQPGVTPSQLLHPHTAAAAAARC